MSVALLVVAVLGGIATVMSYALLWSRLAVGPAAVATAWWHPIARDWVSAWALYTATTVASYAAVVYWQLSAHFDDATLMALLAAFNWSAALWVFATTASPRAGAVASVTATAAISVAWFVAAQARGPGPYNAAFAALVVHHVGVDMMWWGGARVFTSGPATATATAATMPPKPEPGERTSHVRLSLSALILLWTAIIWHGATLQFEGVADLDQCAVNHIFAAHGVPTRVDCSTVSFYDLARSELNNNRIRAGITNTLAHQTFIAESCTDTESCAGAFRDSVCAGIDCTTAEPTIDDCAATNPAPDDPTALQCELCFEGCGRPQLGDVMARLDFEIGVHQLGGAPPAAAKIRTDDWYMSPWHSGTQMFPGGGETSVYTCSEAPFSADSGDMVEFYRFLRGDVCGAALESRCVFDRASYTVMVVASLALLGMTFKMREKTTVGARAVTGLLCAVLVVLPLIGAYHAFSGATLPVAHTDTVALAEVSAKLVRSTGGTADTQTPALLTPADDAVLMRLGTVPIDKQRECGHQWPAASSAAMALANSDYRAALAATNTADSDQQRRQMLLMLSEVFGFRVSVTVFVWLRLLVSAAAAALLLMAALDTDGVAFGTPMVDQIEMSLLG